MNPEDEDTHGAPIAGLVADPGRATSVSGSAGPSGVRNAVFAPPAGTVITGSSASGRELSIEVKDVKWDGVVAGRPVRPVPTIVNTMQVLIYPGYTMPAPQPGISPTPPPFQTLYIWSDGIVTHRNFRDLPEPYIGLRLRTGANSVDVPTLAWIDSQDGACYFQHKCNDTPHVEKLPLNQWTLTSDERVSKTPNPGECFSISPAIVCNFCSLDGWWRANVWVPDKHL